MNCDDFLATLPSLFFPNMVARSGDDKDPAVGIEAFRPEHRKALTKTVNSKDKVDKVGSPGRFHSSGHQGDSAPQVVIGYSYCSSVTMSYSGNND